MHDSGFNDARFRGVRYYLVEPRDRGFLTTKMDPKHSQYPKYFGEVVWQFLLISNRAAHLPSGVVHKIFQFAAPLDYRPVTRLHQRCVFGPQMRQYFFTEEGQPETEIPPTTVQDMVLKAAKNLVGMGKVNTWTDAGDGEPPCRAKQDTELECIMDRPEDHFYISSFLHPLYFDFPARNAVEHPSKGASCDWIS